MDKNLYFLFHSVLFAVHEKHMSFFGLVCCNHFEATGIFLDFSGSRQLTNVFISENNFSFAVCDQAIQSSFVLQFIKDSDGKWTAYNKDKQILVRCVLEQVNEEIYNNFL